MLYLDWLQSLVAKYFFLIILFNNPLKIKPKKYHDYKRWSLVMIYIFVVVFFCFILVDYQTRLQEKYLVTGDWSQSNAVVYIFS